MRYVVLLITIVLSLLMIGLSNGVEMIDRESSDDPIQSIYKEETSAFFFLDRNSSFYRIYSFNEDPPYLPLRKVGHFVVFGFLAGMVFLMLPIKPLWRRGLYAASSASLVGLIDEFHQHFLINRSGRILDVYINAAGSLVAVLLLMAIFILFKWGRSLIVTTFNDKNEDDKKIV
jgi:VanZ family protein